MSTRIQGVFVEKKLNLEIENNTIVNQLVSILQNRIISGEAKPGSKMSEPSLSKEFGISRVPTREALIILEGQGLIKKTYSGREVVRISNKTLRELFEIKIALEGFISYNLTGKLSTSQEKMLNALILKMEKHISRKENELSRKISADFHDTLIVIFGNMEMTELYKSTVQKIRWATSISFNLPHRYELTVKEHTDILNALKEGKKEHAMYTILMHSTNSMNRILEYLSKQGHE